MQQKGTMVTLVSVCKKTGEQYTSGKANYVGCKGLLFIENASQRGKSIGSFFTEKDGTMCRFQTSSGDVKETNRQIQIETKNSIYVFNKGVHRI